MEEKKLSKDKNEFSHIALTVSIVLVIIYAIYVKEKSKNWSPKIETPIAPSLNVNNTMDDIYKKVMYDAIEQYNIAAREGDPMQMYTQAGLVVAACLQAQDEEAYRAWKKTQKELAKQIGLNFNPQ